MEHKPPLKEGERVWIRHPHINNGSLAITIPAHIRKLLNWHMNAPFVVTLEGDHVEVRQLDLIKAAGVSAETKTLRRRRKSWQRGPQEDKRQEGGFVVGSRPPETEEP